jgi:hypothetical protein
MKGRNYGLIHPGDFPIAEAGRRFQSFPIGDCDDSPHVADQPRLLQGGRPKGATLEEVMGEIRVAGSNHAGTHERGRGPDQKARDHSDQRESRYGDAGKATFRRIAPFHQ